MDISPDVVLIEQFFDALKQRGIAFAVLRNADEIAAGDAHDVDMTIDITRMREAASCLQRIAAEQGWLLHGISGILSDPFHTKTFHFWKELGDGKQPLLAHLDICATLPWCGHILISNEEMVANIDEHTFCYPQVNQAVEAIYGVFNRLLFTGLIKPRYKERVQELFANHTESIKKLLSVFLSEANIERLITDIASANWDAVEQSREAYIRDIRRIAPSCKAWYHLHRLEKVWSRPGCFIAVEGADATGKSTLIENLPEVLERLFPGDVLFHYHWRPRYIAHGQESGKTSEADRIPSAHTMPTRFGSLFKLALFTLDFALGYWLRVRWQSAHGWLVAFEGYYYDLYLNPLRYGIQVSDFWLRFMQAFVPSPDVTIVLIGEPESLWQRGKKEISLQDLQLQMKKLQQYRRFFANPVNIDVTRPIQQVVNSAASAVLQTQMHRFFKN